MINKIAKAIATKDLPESYRDRAWQDILEDKPDLAEKYRSDARAALSALEEPSEAQLYAAHKAAKPYFDRGETVHAIRHALQAMIRTAKGGEG